MKIENVAQFKGEMYNLPMGETILKKSDYKRYMEKNAERRRKFLNVDAMSADFKTKSQLYNDVCRTFTQKAMYFNGYDSDLDKEVASVLETMYWKNTLIEFHTGRGEYEEATQIMDDYLQRVLSVTTKLDNIKIR